MGSRKWPKILAVMGIITVTTIAVVGMVVSLATKDADYVDAIIQVAPTSATVKVDGDYYPYRNIMLKRGVHEVEVSKFGFKTETRLVDVRGQNEVIGIALQPNMSFTMDWYAVHMEDGVIYTEILDGEIATEKAELIMEHPAIAKLPIKTSEYNIDLAACMQGYDWAPLCVEITAASYADSVAAIEYFREKIDEELGNYYFCYTGQPGAADFYEIYSVNDIPEPNYLLNGDNQYALAIFMVEGLVYRALYMNDGAGRYVNMGSPAPVLSYDNFLNVSKEVIRAANKVVVEQ